MPEETTPSLPAKKGADIQKINQSYLAFLDQMKALEKKQAEIVADFRKELDRRKIALIRKNLDTF